jgi:NADH-quinone oxidoreductase subunit N
MSAPLLWIFLPAGTAVLLWLPRNQRLVTLVACLLTLFLGLAAWLLPIDTALTLGSFTFKIAPALSILGRRLVLSNADRTLLTLIYGSAFLWFVPAGILKMAQRLLPPGLIITALLVASIAVEPFLYAALLIESAVLLAIPLLSPPGQKPGNGLLRFLIFQTLAMPFILFSGWLLAGIEANPGDLGLVTQAAILLGLGFAFLLAVIPFHTWIPMLVEEVHPLSFGFVLWMFPTITIFFGLGFLDRYTWLRTSGQLNLVLATVGGLMVVTGGLLAAFQQHLGRIFAYTLIAESGFSLLAISLGSASGLEAFLLLLIPRLLAMVIWSLALSILRPVAPELTYNAVKGLGRKWPFAAAGIVLANLSLAGLPLLAGFPPHLAVWERLASQSLPLLAWVFLGSLGLIIAAVRSLAALSAFSPGGWRVNETVLQRLFLLGGWLALLIIGLLPQWGLLLWDKLPALFEHLGQ